MPTTLFMDSRLKIAGMTPLKFARHGKTFGHSSSEPALETLPASISSVIADIVFHRPLTRESLPRRLPAHPECRTDPFPRHPPPAQHVDVLSQYLFDLADSGGGRAQRAQEIVVAQRLHKPTHRSQMYTPGPPISFATASSCVRQNEQ
jgi:hypothetical protein